MGSGGCFVSRSQRCICGHLGKSLRPAHQETAAVRTYQISAQPLASALTKFGQQSGLQVSVSSATAKGRTSPGVSGTLSADQALSQLLSGTGASFRLAVTTRLSFHSARARAMKPVRRSMVQYLLIRLM
ncbi:STN domain-containing protein [Hyphomicrobium sulfonivorans]|uniref:STN domain-containing protein n=1 Tax=Hyphomicrobium sulfonivorans TaxID=121290 RepID=UPI003B846811